jgi:chromosome segregation ATPase
MKLSKRIRDLVRANLASSRRLTDLSGARSPDQLETQLEHIRRSLVRSAAREKQLQDDLTLAEQEGRERDVIRLRRELSELGKSTHELQAALDVIAARMEMTRESKDQAPPQPYPAEASPTAEEVGSPQTSLAAPEDEDNLAARKARLAKPQGEQKPTATKPRQAQRD